MASSLDQILERIRNSPKLQSQQQTHMVLNAVEDTLKDQKTAFTPTAYFSALLALLGQYIAGREIVNKDVATAVVYLLDLVTPHVSAALLRSKFSQILQKLSVILLNPESDAPLVRPSLGCLESLLLVQDAHAWALPVAEASPRRATALILSLSTDHRPKVRKRAQDALSKVLKNPPPSPALDHPVADMCAETALRKLKDGMEANKKQQQHHKKHQNTQNHNMPNLYHILTLIKSIAMASGGWPSRKLDSLVETLLEISRSNSEYVVMASFEVFEVIFAGMAADEVRSAKLPHLLEILEGLQPSEKDSQLLPPWLAVLSRAYDVYSQISSQECFEKLPIAFEKVANFLSSMSNNIRVSASDCLISFLVNCVPASVLIEPSVYDERYLESLAKIGTGLLAVKYQSAWMDVFRVLGAMFDSLHKRSDPILGDVIRIIGELRGNDSFNGIKEADAVLGKAIRAIGPEAVLKTLPLNLANKNAPGRVWLLPIMRDSVSNTQLDHFKSALIPLSEELYQKVLDHGEAEKTLEIKIYETVILQIWSTLPGYCDLPRDLVSAFDQKFAEQLSNILYQQVDLRTILCQALERLVDSNKDRINLEDDESLALLGVSKADAASNLNHLQQYASNLLAVLFNTYTQTLPSYRGPILKCINAYLGIMSEEDIVQTFERVTSMLEESLLDTNGSSKKNSQQNGGGNKSQMPPLSHTLMDLVISITSYLPRASLATLFDIAILMLGKNDASLQKKAYKIIPRLTESDIGKLALQERNNELQKLIVDSSENVLPAARHDRLLSIAKLIEYLPETDLHFIFAVLSEVVLCTREHNEKARTAAYDLLVSMGESMAKGGTIDNTKVPHMPSDAPPTKQASLEEYFTMTSAGLAGTAPHAVSACISALSRLLFQFKDDLSIETVDELVETMDIFLKSPNREIVRSVLGFVKVSVISLPSERLEKRLSTLVPNLLDWSGEHKAHVQAKVKHIFERLIRRFGADKIERLTPEKDKKLIANIRKVRDRRKKKNQQEQGGDSLDKNSTSTPRRFENNAYDEALYASDEDNNSFRAESSSGSDISDDEVFGKSAAQRKKKKGQGLSFIVEDAAEPLDLLDSKSLARISSTKPMTEGRGAKSGQGIKTWRARAKYDADGKLIFGDTEQELQNGSQEKEDGAGIDAYMAAMKGADAPKKTPKGKLKFSNRRGEDNDGENDEDAMEVDERDVAKTLKDRQKMRQQPKQRGKQQRGKPNMPGNRKFAGSGFKGQKNQRRGLGVDKTRGGRVVKAGGARR